MHGMGECNLLKIHALNNKNVQFSFRSEVALTQSNALGGGGVNVESSIVHQNLHL